MADPIEEILRELDQPVQPRPEFGSRLLEQLLHSLRARTTIEVPARRRFPLLRELVAAAALLIFVTGVAVAFSFFHSGKAPSPAVHQPVGGTIVFGRVINAKGDEYLFTIRADGTGERALLATPTGCCRSVKWSHNGDRVQLAISAPPPFQNLVTTATVKADGSDYRVLPLDSTGLSLQPGAWSPDDSRIAFEGLDRGDPSRSGIYTADAADEGNRRRVTTTATDDIPISYSPDGSKIFFWRLLPNNTDNGQLFVVGVDGSQLTQVSPAGMTVWVKLGDPGGWSPDGTHISFAAFSPVASYPGRSAVFVAASDGTNPVRISDWGPYTTSARWSPTGDWIVFDKVDAPAGDHRLYLVHPDGSGTKAIPSLVRVCCAVWSPDGNRLMFVHGPTDTASDLWTVQLDGSHLTRLTHTPARYSLANIGWSGAR